MEIQNVHPSGMLRVDLGSVNLTKAQYDYVFGACIERDEEWSEFVKQALLEWAAR